MGRLNQDPSSQLIGMSYKVYNPLHRSGEQGGANDYRGHDHDALMKEQMITGQRIKRATRPRPFESMDSSPSPDQRARAPQALLSAVFASEVETPHSPGMTLRAQPEDVPLGTSTHEAGGLLSAKPDGMQLQSSQPGETY